MAGDGYGMPAGRIVVAGGKNRPIAGWTPRVEKYEPDTSDTAVLSGAVLDLDVERRQTARGKQVHEDVCMPSIRLEHR